jgi:transcriptional regulator with XRE-family HTH domain
MAYCNPIRIWRTVRGLRQADVARLAGINGETLCRAETNLNAFTAMRPRTRARLAAVLGVPLRELEQLKHIAEDDLGITPSPAGPPDGR